ncbi:flagellar motor protein MotB [Pseudalgibacter alginicilyticus]|uniref:Flagellar motor protein MotB n=1 Tax=Pseudalgibacter alginicilyticus TaxID=1736674 RepID=A0A0P0CUC1_9FLAO|nr:OmpA family protein [Pseudalgibacter alginicilyticus]ALJ03939.1 flagellar motor protein MotB [Pseudalgibacter alginicilyticus]
MKTKINLLACLLFSISSTSFAQQNSLDKADALFNKFSFYKATNAYKELIEKNYNKDYAYRQLADCYSFMRNPDSASVYYKKTVVQKNVPVEYLYNYAQSLRGIGNYEASRTWFENYKKQGGLTNTSIFYNDDEFINRIYNSKQQYFLKDVIFNTKLSEFGAYEHHGNIYFTSTRDAGVAKKFKSGWDNQPFLDMYVIKKGSTHSVVDNKYKIKGKVNSVYHDGPLTISKDGKTMYFSRNNFKKNILKTDNQEIGNLKIYQATLVNNKWKKIKELSFNNDTYSTGHPALNNDGTKLYFTSDMPGGYGGTDIYYVDINPNGSMGKPKNLGEIVNTKKDESFPFVNSENTLFFSSDGHLGLGLLDIFGTVANENNEIVNVLNLGIPINSSKDDFSFFMNEDGNSGYFASNRKEGIGSDDIYAFDRTPLLKIESTILNKEGLPIENATVILLNSEGHQVAQLQSDKNGKLEIGIDRNSDYTIKVEKVYYIQDSKKVTSKNIDDKTTIIKTQFNLNPIVKKATLIAEFSTIYFDYDDVKINKTSMRILDTMADLLINTFPNVTIKIESHTDARGSYKYNKILSNKRAQATYNYLVSKGVNPSRITEYTGFGKQNLLNNCDSIPNCSEAQHQLNRRTQIFVNETN